MLRRPKRSSAEQPTSLEVNVVHVLELFEDVAYVEKRGALEPDVHERRLHARQHLYHAALVDVAGIAPVLGALDEYFRDQLVLQERDPRLLVRGVYYYLC